MELKIRECRLDEIVELRWEVLRARLPRETAVFAGDELETSLHVGAYLAERVVGCLTLHASAWDGKPAWQLRGMAVSEAVRGMGLGRKLMEWVVGWVRERDVKVMWCNARVPAVGFYVAMGWQMVGGEFEIPTAGPHVRMVRVLG